MSSINTLYEVERIIKHRMKNGKREFLIKWVGYPKKDNSWEPEPNLMYAPDILNTYLNTRVIKTYMSSLNLIF